MNEPTRAKSRAFWDSWYGRAKSVRPLGAERTYVRALRWLDQPGWTLEDWGGGLGYASKYVHQASYRIVDGSARDPANRHELAEYRSSPDAILLRHVLEHNPNTWPQILDNALASFRRRMVLVLFTPFQAETGILTEGPRAGVRVPVLGFARADIVGRYNGIGWSEEEIARTRRDEAETIHYLTKEAT